MTSTLSPTLALEEFLLLPETKPASEFADGKVVQKIPPRLRHSWLRIRLCRWLDDSLTPNYEAFLELRCTFGGQSLVPDIAVLSAGQIPRNAEGEIGDDVFVAPRVAVEILSPGQTMADFEEKARFYISHGVQVALLIDPEDKRVQVFRPGMAPQMLGLDGVLEDSALPGLRLPVAELFGWLKAGVAGRA